MKYTRIVLFTALVLPLAGCDMDGRAKNQKDDPAFMFWCFRKEVVTDEFQIPEMRSAAAAAYLQNRAKSVPGYENSTCDIASGTMTVSYKSSTSRKMNFEEAIALAGFKVNNRPADPNAKIPEGVK